MGGTTSHSEHVEGGMSTITDKLWGIYRESRDAGLDVSLTVSICNGAETFVFKSVPSNGVADMGNHGRRKHGRGRGRGRRGGRAQRAARSAGAAQLAAAAVSSAESPVDDIGTAPRAAASSVANVVVAMPAAVEHPRPLPPFTMELRRRAVSFSSPSPSPIIFSTPSPSTTPLSPLQQLDGLTSPDPNPSASSPSITNYLYFSFLKRLKSWCLAF